MNTKRTLYEIEVGLAKLDEFNYIKNIVAYNVYGLGASLNIGHECDMLVLNKSGYLSEIEIKRSWEDFKNDFKKKHSYESYGNIIKYFYYCIPETIYDKVIEYISDKKRTYNMIITYDEELNFKFHTINVGEFEPNLKYRKLFLEEQLQVARFGAMRAVKLKEKIIFLNKNLDE